LVYNGIFLPVDLTAVWLYDVNTSKDVAVGMYELNQTLYRT
jgi:hypothetical protein